MVLCQSSPDAKAFGINVVRHVFLFGSIHMVFCFCLSAFVLDAIPSIVLASGPCALPIFYTFGFIMSVMGSGRVVDVPYFGPVLVQCFFGRVSWGRTCVDKVCESNTLQSEARWDVESAGTSTA